MTAIEIVECVGVRSRGRSVLFGVCIFAITACTPAGGSDSTRDIDSLVEQSASKGSVALPFEPSFSRRSNSANDGTDYEPCVAVGPRDLAALGVDPYSVRDAAGTDGQTARGCLWRYADLVSEAGWTVSQIVGNSPSLAHAKRKASGTHDAWFPDLDIHGRTVGVHYLTTGGDCDTYVQSGKAAVSTIVVTLDPGVPVSEICDRAIAFTKATIDKIPH